MSKIWYILIVVGIIVSIFTGHFEQLGEIILGSCSAAFDIFLKLALLILFWNGIFQIAIDSGLIKHITQFLKKPLSKIFPEVDPDSLVMEYICSNMVANILGLGSAATPLGLKAFEELQHQNPHPERPSRSMVTLILVNVSTITLFPTTIIGLRTLCGGKSDLSLIAMMILVSTFSTIVAIVLDRIFYRIGKRKCK